jgi:hypothetical protein
MTTIVYYYIPEDREDPEKLNAFLIYKEIDSLKINDVKENFPLPGQYHFRFKFKFENKNVWIDFNNPDASLPRYDGKIIMKVTRISWEDPNIQNNKGYEGFLDMI